MMSFSWRGAQGWNVVLLPLQILASSARIKATAMQLMDYRSAVQLNYYLKKSWKKMLLILGNICGQNFRSERVNINQLEHQDINLVLLKEGRSPPSTHAHTHTCTPPFPLWDQECRPVHVSAPVGKHCCIQPNGDGTQQPTLNKAVSNRSHGFGLILKVPTESQFKFWMTHGDGGRSQLRPEKESPHLNL